MESLSRTFIMEPVDEVVSKRQPTLVVLTGAHLGTLHNLGEQTVLGRSEECQVVLDDDGVSRKHAVIRSRGAHFEIEDLGSTNGTYVEGQRIRVPTRLENGTSLRMGSVALRFALQNNDELRAHQQMYDMSVRDGLTGLYNRRYFDDRFESEFAFSMRHRAPLAVLMCDLDHFKQVNDRYGHAAGDAVLRAVAKALHDRVRTEDVVARFGGEEICVLARGIDVPGARAFAERMLHLVRTLNVEHDGVRIPVTLSIGVAHTHSISAGKPEALLIAADAALYQAKRAGRDRVELAGSPGRYSVHEPARTPDAAPAPVKKGAVSVVSTRDVTSPVDVGERSHAFNPVRGAKSRLT